MISDMGPNEKEDSFIRVEGNLETFLTSAQLFLLRTQNTEVDRLPRKV